MQPEELADPHDRQAEDGQEYDQDRARHRGQLLVAVDSPSEEGTPSRPAAAGQVDIARPVGYGVLQRAIRVGTGVQGVLTD